MTLDVGAIAVALGVVTAEPIILGEGGHDVFHSKFTQFIQKFEKEYEIDEIPQKFATFIDNWKAIENHNSMGNSYTLAMNEFGDLSGSEFKDTYFGYEHVPRDYARSQNLYKAPEGEVLADSVDWRAKGAVTPVKNQGQCGSCWAFSTTGSLEGANQITSGKLLSLSEQQLVDCSTSEGNNGCNGGLMDYGFEYVIKNGGIGSEDSYAYMGKDGTCKQVDSVATCSKYSDVPKGDEKTLMSGVSQGPVSIAIEADHLAFQFYSKGVFDNARCGTNLDHGVLLVGYDTDASSGKDYWIVKNSWGATWGQQGYIWLARDKDMCGLADSASFPSP